MHDIAKSQSRSSGVSPSTFRLPDSTHVGAVHLQVSDRRLSIAYYTQVIGLRVVEDTIDAATRDPRRFRMKPVFSNGNSWCHPSRMWRRWGNGFDPPAPCQSLPMTD